MPTASGIRLKAYWQTKAEAGRVPMRSDIEPAEMRPWLPDLMIAEVQPDGCFRVRLAGTQVTRRLGWEPTGETICPDTPGSRLGVIADLMREAIRESHPTAGRINYPGSVDSFDGIDCTVVPLRVDENAGPSQLMVAMDFVFAATSLDGHDHRGNGTAL